MSADDNHYDDEKISATFLELMQFAGVNDQVTINNSLYQVVEGLLKKVLENEIALTIVREEVKTLFINLTEDLLQLQTDIAALIDVASQAGADFNKTRLELEDHYRKCALYTLEQQIQHYTDESQGK
jgi:hypothetical protein